MNHPESAIADFYDHEREPASSDRRRREAPDWGGDDLFTTTPRRRRFERPVRGDHAADAADHAHRRETVEHPIQRPAAVRARAGAATTGREPEVAFTAMTASSEAALEEPAGRRTVTITGRPDSLPARRRPAPTLEQRFVGSNPERIAAYAFALGVLLIVIAFLSANA